MKAKYYTQSDVDKIVKETEKKTASNVIEYCMMLTAWAAWDTIEGATSEMVQRIIDFMSEKSSEYIAKGDINVSDIAAMLKEETGIVMHFDKEYFK